MEKKEPELRMGIPIWCHMHGSKMRVEKLDLENRTLLISGSAAHCFIKKASHIFPKMLGWFIDYEVIHSSNVKIKGSIWLNTKDLESAFELSSDSGNFGDWLIERFGADVANQGKYIRYKNYLNIPGPGTGHDGDANISIHLDETIKDAIRSIL